jgi:hypothetical protein
MVAKKPVKKSTPTRKPVAKKAVSRKRKEEMKSFKLYKSDENFSEFRFTKQTLYWTILLGFIAFTQLWILKVQLEIAEITNAIVLM